MPSARNRLAHKHFRLDRAKIKRAQRALKTSTETETIERALDFVLSEDERNRLAWAAHEQFVMGGGLIRDVYGNLEE